MFSSDKELEEFAEYLLRYCPRSAAVLVLTSAFSDGLDENLRWMMTFGKDYWRNMESISSGLPSLN